MNAQPTKKNPAIQNVDYSMIQIANALRYLDTVRGYANVENDIRKLEDKLISLSDERKALRKAEFRQRNIQQRLNGLYVDLATVTREGKGPKSKAYKNISDKILDLVAKL